MDGSTMAHAPTTTTSTGGGGGGSSQRNTHCNEDGVVPP